MISISLGLFVFTFHREKTALHTVDGKKSSSWNRHMKPYKESDHFISHNQLIKPPQFVSHYSSWWLFPNPSEKYAQVKMDHFPNFRGENTKDLSCHHLVQNSHKRHSSSQVPHPPQKRNRVLEYHESSIFKTAKVAISSSSTLFGHFLGRRFPSRIDRWQVFGSSTDFSNTQITAGPGMEGDPLLGSFRKLVNG